MSNKSFLALHLEGPLQSWGYDSQYSRRNTGLMPTKSAIAGICCAALRLPRGSEEEIKFLYSFRNIRMTAIAIPRYAGKTEKELEVRRLQDYHTVQNTKKADGSVKECHITHRQYLTDARFGVLLEGERIFLEKIASALSDPKWGVWLGRKCCIPSAPILAGLKEEEDDALRLLIGDKPISSFTCHEEVADFAEGKDSLPDQPISFHSEKRQFSHRRIQLRLRKI